MYTVERYRYQSMTDNPPKDTALVPLCTLCMWESKPPDIATVTAISPSGTRHNLCMAHAILYGNKYTEKEQLTAKLWYHLTTPSNNTMKEGRE